MTAARYRHPDHRVLRGGFQPSTGRQRVVAVPSTSDVGLRRSHGLSLGACSDSSDDISRSDSSDDSGDVVALAKALSKTLDEDQVEDLNQHYSFSNAAAWSNLPQALLTEGTAGGTPNGDASGTPGGEAGNAAPILGQYEDELNENYVAYAGDVAMETTGDYVRIDGPSVWIEFAMRKGVVLHGAHPHAAWRDKTDDYGGLTP